MNDVAPRVIAPQQAEQDAPESSVRPATLDEFVGQHQLRDNLRVFIEAAKSRGEALDHILFFGPPGLGKTTLAQIVAREMGVDFHATAGPVIQRAADLVAMLSKLAPREVLFIDEIHRLPPAAEEYLYPAMEDYQIDLIIGQGPGARSIRYRLAPFTLIGATTRSGLITRPLRERFGIPLRLVFYEPAELGNIVNRAARVLGIVLSPDGATEIAQRSRGPRASRSDCCAASATSPQSTACRALTPRPPTERCSGSTSMPAASTAWTGATCAALLRIMRAARSGSRRSRRRSVTSATSSKRSSSRTCSRRVSCSARRVAAC
jgi:Mg-chelatase subunit ChlI